VGVFSCPAVALRSFEGVLGKELANPIPEWAEHRVDRKVVPYGVATSMDTPNPDPGEEYDAIRGSASPDGSNVYNTLLMVSFDEHGVTYDHVPPPPAPPPGPGASPRRDLAVDPGTQGGRRRVPQHLRPPHDARALVPRRAVQRPRSDRPLPPQRRPAGHTPTTRGLARLRGAASAGFPHQARARGPATRRTRPGLAKEIGQTVPDVGPDTMPTGREAVAIMRESFGQLFPNLQAAT
jgi:Phosphoesterase family